MKLSAIISIHNTQVRNELFFHAFRSLHRQTLSPQDWEVVLVDDGSPIDPSEVYMPYLRAMNIRHVILDRSKHPIFQEMNPEWMEGPGVFPHTPALSINVGLRLARGEVVEITQPEVIHESTALERGANCALASQEFVFGGMVLAGLNFNLQYFHNPQMEFEEAWSRACNSVYFDEWGEVKPTPVFKGQEMYWYLAFHRREAALRVGGVDEDYLRGVYAEDCKYKHCLWLAGYPPRYEPGIRGIHLSHSYERIPNQKREGPLWERWARQNREAYAEWGILFQRALRGEIPPQEAYKVNRGRDWGSLECVREVREFTI